MLAMTSCDHLPPVLSLQARQCCYLLAETVHPAEVKPRYSLRTAAPVNLNSRTNNSDPPGQRGAAVTTARVSVLLRGSAPSAVTETCMTGQNRVLPVIPVPDEHKPGK